MSAVSTRINPLTKIGKNDYNGKPCPGQFYDRLRALNTHAYPSSQHYLHRNVIRGQYAVRRLAEKLHLSEQIIEHAFRLYNKVVKAQLTRGRSIPGMAAAVLYLACKDCGTPRSSLEFKPIIERPKTFFQGLSSSPGFYAGRLAPSY
jgi:transcription initiation factor TFIIIB Brf1 subunit/transcription initiation factor TFIIB